MKVDIGYGSAYKQQPVLIRNMKDFEKDCKAGVLIASGVGRKKVIALAAKAKELGLTVVNMKKAKKALRFVADMEKRKEEAKKKKHENKVETKPEHSDKTEHKHDHSAEHKHEAIVEHKHEAKTEAKSEVKHKTKNKKDEKQSSS